MGEIEVNEYVRTNAGYIAKLKQYLSNTGTYLFDDFIQEIQGDKYRCISENELEKVTAKHSKQPIDLIEVGDIVNKELVIGIIDITNDKEEIIGRKLITQYRSAQFTGLDIKHYIYDKDIKTILTHEQFEQNSYKLGGK